MGDDRFLRISCFDFKDEVLHSVYLEKNCIKPSRKKFKISFGVIPIIRDTLGEGRQTVTNTFLLWKMLF